MISNWTDYPGVVTGTWRLESFLGVRENVALYRAAHTEDGTSALVEIISEDTEIARAVRRSWELASNFTEPHILKVYETGEADFDGSLVSFAAIELPDDDVGEILGQRTLNADEARMMTIGAARGLEYLHRHGLGHGAVGPANLLIVGDEIKLSVDTISPADDIVRHWDMRRLGNTIVQALTGESSELARLLPAPFSEIAAGCLEAPNRQWPAERVLRRFALPSVEPVVSAVDPRPASGNRTARPVSRPNSGRRDWAALTAAGAGVVALVGYWVFHVPEPRQRIASDKVAARQQAPPVSKKLVLPVESAGRGLEAAAPARVQARQEPLQPKAQREAAQAREADRARSTAGQPASEKAAWAVIAATYVNHEAAQERAHKLARRSPRLQPHVFPPAGQGSRYYVVLGSGLTQHQAEKLRKGARALGAPSDTYVTKLDES